MQDLDPIISPSLGRKHVGLLRAPCTPLRLVTAQDTALRLLIDRAIVAVTHMNDSCPEGLTISYVETWRPFTMHQTLNLLSGNPFTHWQRRCCVGFRADIRELVDRWSTLRWYERLYVRWRMCRLRLRPTRDSSDSFVQLPWLK